MSRGILRHLACAALVLAAYLVGGMPAALFAVGLTLPVVVRTRDGRMWWAAIAERARFRWGTLREGTSAKAAGHPPGSLSQLDLVTVGSGAAIVGPGTVTFLIDADHLADDEWLSLLTVDSGPETVSVTSACGIAVAPHVRLREGTPLLARRALQQMLPAASGLPNRWVAATWLTGDDPQDVALYAQRHLQELPLLNAREICGLISLAFNPRESPATQWESAGPRTAHAWPNRYDHDDWTSLSWRLSSVPDDASRLLTAQPEVPVKRITRNYRRHRAGLTESVIITASCPAGQQAELVAAAQAIRQAARDCAATLAASGVATRETFVAGIGVAPETAKLPRWTITYRPRFAVDAPSIGARWPHRAPAEAVPLGLDTADDHLVRADPVALPATGELRAPRTLVGGQAVALLRRWLLGRAALGSRPLVLGDADGACAQTVSAMGGQVITIGRGHDSLNLLDDPRHRTAALEALLTAAGNRSLSPVERGTLRRAVDAVAAEQPSPLLWHVHSTLQKNPDGTRLTRILGSILHHYGDVLDRHTSFAVDRAAPAVCLRISQDHRRDPFLMAVLTAACWSAGAAIADATTFQVVCGASTVSEAGMLDRALALVTDRIPTAIVADRAQDLGPIHATMVATVNDAGTVRIEMPDVPVSQVVLAPTTTENAVARGEVSTDEMYVPAEWVGQLLDEEVKRTPAFASVSAVKTAPVPIQTGGSGGEPPAPDGPPPAVPPQEPGHRLPETDSPAPGAGRWVYVLAALAALAGVLAVSIATVGTAPSQEPLRAGQGAQLFAASPVQPQPAAAVAVAAARPPQVGGGGEVAARVPPLPRAALVIAAPLTPSLAGSLVAAAPVEFTLGAALAPWVGVPPAPTSLGGAAITAAARPKASIRLRPPAAAWQSAARWQQRNDYVPPPTIYTPVAPVPLGVPAAPAQSPTQPVNPVPAPPQPGAQPAPQAPGTGGGGSPPRVPGPPPPNQPFNPQNPDSQP